MNITIAKLITFGIACAVLGCYISFGIGYIMRYINIKTLIDELLDNYLSKAMKLKQFTNPIYKTRDGIKLIPIVIHDVGPKMYYSYYFENLYDMVTCLKSTDTRYEFAYVKNSKAFYHLQRFLITSNPEFSMTLINPESYVLNGEYIYLSIDFKKAPITSLSAM